MLYDEQFINQLPPSKQFENPWVVGICKFDNNEELRRLIEKWYANLPKVHQPKFRTKLRSLKNADFISAFYELVAHQYCLEEGWEVEYEPPQPSGKAPDFLVTTKNGYKFILEVATIFDSAEVKAANDKKEAITQAITEIDTPFVLDLEYKSLPDNRVHSPKEVAKMVKEWLDKLDQTDKSKRHKMGFGYKSLSVMIEATLNAPKPSKGCVFSIMDPGGQVPDYSERIKSVLDDKAKKYSSKKTKLPLVVMIGDGVGRVRLSDTTIDRTLFGRDVITFGGEEPPAWHKDRSGHFTPSNDENLEWFGRRTGLSAVLYCSLQEKGSFQMQVFHNPLPHIQLAEDVFHKMPQLLKWENPRGITMRWVISNPSDSRVFFI